MLKGRRWVGAIRVEENVGGRTRCGVKVVAKEKTGSTSCMRGNYIAV